MLWFRIIELSLAGDLERIADINIAYFCTVVIVITFFLPSCFGQETAKELSVFESSCHLSHTRESSFNTVLIIAERQTENLEYQFFWCLV